MGDAFAGKAGWFDEHYATTRGDVRLRLVLERVLEGVPEPPRRVLDVGGGTGAFAVPLARRGFEVTLVDASAEWLDVAARRAAEVDVSIDCIEAPLARVGEIAEAAFDVVIAHTVLLYTEDPYAGLRTLRSVAVEGAFLSLLEKNRDGIAFRPGLQGDYAEARRLLTERRAVGKLGIPNVAYAPDEWLAMLERARWRPVDWAGIRLFSDLAPDHLPAETLEELVALEREAGTRDPYRRVARLIHVMARAQ